MYFPATALAMNKEFQMEYECSAIIVVISVDHKFLPAMSLWPNCDHFAQWLDNVYDSISKKKKKMFCCEALGYMYSLGHLLMGCLSISQCLFIDQ